MRFLNIVIILFLFQACSFNNDSKYWNEHNDQKIADKKKLIEIIKKSEDITLMTIDEYNIFIDDYVKKSKFPNISK
tara:strand:+ start:627 stop:854 length:228 start_codon:yes stop_codon:yes gene_type:complete